MKSYGGKDLRKQSSYRKRVERKVLSWLDDLCEEPHISKQDRLEFAKARKVLWTAMCEGRANGLSLVCVSLIETCDLWIKQVKH